jgi:hypothetical protein
MSQSADDGTDNAMREAFHLFMDGDLDNTWTIWVTPQWRAEAITGERDGAGIINCRGLTGSELMNRVWQESHQVQPRSLNAVHGGDYMHRLAHQDEDWELREGVRRWWKRSGEWCLEEGPHTLDDLNGKWWQLVLWNHPVLDTMSGANAVIYYGNWFYLAQLDMEPVNIPGVA